MTRVLLNTHLRKPLLLHKKNKYICYKSEPNCILNLFINPTLYTFYVDFIA